MRNKLSQKQIVAEKLLTEGRVSNFWAFNEGYILRLASIINTLRKEGWEIRTEYEGVVGNKNCWYVLVEAGPTEIGPTKEELLRTNADAIETFNRL